MKGTNLTLIKLTKLYSQCKEKEIKKLHDELQIDYNKVSQLSHVNEPFILSKSITERLLYYLLLNNYLAEKSVKNQFSSNDYIIEGELCMMMVVIMMMVMMMVVVRMMMMMIS